MALPTDPKKAAALGKAWGEVLGDLIFGIMGDVRKHKNKQAANRAVWEANKGIKQNNAILRDMAAKQVADQQIRDQLARMTPSQRAEFAKRKAQMEARAKAEADAAEENAANIKIWAAVIITISIVCYIGLLAAGIMIGRRDYAAYQSMRWIPGLETIIGR